MKLIRIKVAGLCVAAFACAALAASAAQAAEYGICTKQAAKPYTGNFSDKNCQVLSTEAEMTEGKHNKYEWVPGPGPKPGFTSKGGASVLKSVAGEIACKKNTDVGKMTGVSTDVDTITYEKCALSLTGESCQNHGSPPPGVIKTYELATEILGNGEKAIGGGEPKPGEVWQQFEWNGESHEDPVFGGGHWLASFECGKVPFAVRGGVSGVQGVDINSMQKKSTLEFGTGKGAQGLEVRYLNLQTAQTETVPAEQVGLGKAKYEEKGEVCTTCVGRGRWSSTTSYHNKAIVWWKGSYWESTKGGNKGNEPGMSALWEKL